APSAEELAPFLGEMEESGYLSNFGPIAERYEAELAKQLEVKHCLALSNLSTGLMYMPTAAGLDGGEVIIPSFTFPATAHSMQLGGLTPVFADIDPATLCIDPASVEAAITEHTVAVCGVHIYGTPCDIETLESICAKHRLALFFDSAHALGSHYKGKPVGCGGIAEGFSTSVTKIFTTLGEGGFLATDDDDFAENIRMARNWGHPGDYNARFASIVSKLPEISAAAGLLALPRLGEFVARRNELVHLAKSALSAIPGISFPILPEDCRSGFKDFAMIVNSAEFGLDRDGLANALKSENIETRPYYDPPVHTMDAYKGLNHRVPLKVTEKVAKQVLCLPLYNQMHDDDMQLLCETIAAIHHHAPSIFKKLQN
ncbi:MAG TPA: DegT/DnrJ/EryC1/StrS family aminotransferase, partial [Rhodospirillaceae bacterium]|nr:DegT/DnrJ/EryC1/StrS family aminotransferase [Rhodospirillaceae bacterium]